MKINKAALVAALAVVGSAAAFQAGAGDAQVLEFAAPAAKQQQPQAAGAAAEQQPAGCRTSAARRMPRSCRPIRRSRRRTGRPRPPPLPAAQAGAQSPYARYVVGQLQLEIGRGTQNSQLQSQAVDAMLASGGAPAEVVNRAAGGADRLRARGQQFRGRRSGAHPPRRGRADQRHPAAPARPGQDQAQQAVRGARALPAASSSRPRPAASARRRMSTGRRSPPLMRAASWRPRSSCARTLVAAYPTPDNWRSALGVYRELGGAEPGAAARPLPADARRRRR